MSKIVIRLVFVFFALLLMAFLTIRYIFRKAPDDLGKYKTEMLVNADSMYHDFAQDEVQAMEKYGSKVIELHGKILGIESDEWGQTLLTFVDPFFGVTCTIDSLVSSRQQNLIKLLSSGDSVRLKGRVDGMLTDVKVSKCLILVD